MSTRRDKYLPYHIHFDKLLGNREFNEQYSDQYHKHNLSGVIRLIYEEPFAFYLTEEDKKHYSENDLNALKVVTDIAISKIEEERKQEAKIKPNQFEEELCV